MARNKFNPILVKKNNDLIYEEEMQRVKKEISEKLQESQKNSSIKKILLHSLKKVFHFILWLIRFICIIFLVLLATLIIASLVNPEIKEQMTTIVTLIWNKLYEWILTLMH